MQKYFYTLFSLCSLFCLAPNVLYANVGHISEFLDYSKDYGFGIIEDHWAEKHIRLLLIYNGISGTAFEDGFLFAPDRSITTAELLSIIFRLADIDLQAFGINEQNWPTAIMQSAHQLQLIPSSMLDEGNEPLSREKMAMILVNTANKLLKENTLVTYKGTIVDLNDADIAYREAIKTVYGMGILMGTGDGYSPKEYTTRAETCVIINRLFGYTNRLETEETSLQKFQITTTTALPNKSNVGTNGIIYPKENDIFQYQRISRDESTNILGFGNGQKGGIYLGLVYPKTGEIIEIGSFGISEYDNIGGAYLQYNGYIYWEKEWEIIKEFALSKLNQIPNPEPNMTADIEGNLIIDDSIPPFFHYDTTEKWIFYPNFNSNPQTLTNK